MNTLENEIIEYTKEDFTDGTAPFEYVYQFHGNKFTERQAIEKNGGNST